MADVLNSRAGGLCATDIAAAGGVSPAAGVTYCRYLSRQRDSCFLSGSGCGRFASLCACLRIPRTDSSRLFSPAATALTRPRSGSTTTSTTSRISAPTITSPIEDTFNPFNNFQAAGANVPGFGANSKQRFQQWNLSHTWTVSNNVVNEFRFAYMREAQRTFNHSQHTNRVTDSCASAAAKPFCFTGLSDASAINDPANNVLAGTPLPTRSESLPAWGRSAKAFRILRFLVDSPSATTSKARFRRWAIRSSGRIA